MGSEDERIQQLKGVGYSRGHLLSSPWTVGFLISGYFPRDLCWQELGDWLVNLQ